MSLSCVDVTYPHSLMNNHVSSVEKLNQPIKTSAIPNYYKTISFGGGGGGGGA